MHALERLKEHLKPGEVYRRSDLKQWSNAVDRHVKQLVKTGFLQKLSQGLYYRPAKASFGSVPPEDKKLVRAFLKSNDFLLTSPNAYNSLGVGATQLYNKSVVYNYKRHGDFSLGGKVFHFHLKYKFPKKLSKEFLLVDLMNNLNGLAEDQDAVSKNICRKVLKVPRIKMNQAVNNYAGERTKSLFKEWLSKGTSAHA